MKKNTVRLLGVLLCAAVLAAALTSCGGLSAKEKREQTPVGTCAGYDVLYEELRYVVLTYKVIFESTYGKGIWDTPESAERYRAELEETVFRVMTNNYAVLAACAAYGLTADDVYGEEIDRAVEETIAEAVAEFENEKEYVAEMERLHMTDHLVRFTVRVLKAENELLFVLADDLGGQGEEKLGDLRVIPYNTTSAFAEWLARDNYRYVQHVFVRNDKGDDPVTNRAIAERMREELRSGIKTIGQLVGSADNEDLTNTAPYFMVRGVYTEALESAAFGLARDGAVSDVVETADGFYVLVREAVPAGQLEKEINSLLSSYQWAVLESIVDDFGEGLTIEYNDYGKSLDLLTIE